MAYIKTNWENNVTPINADNLNKIENQLEINSISNDYSTSETVIGTWIGKPLYRKVLSSNGINGNDVSIAHGITNLKRVVNINAVASNDSGTTYPLNNPTYSLELILINSTDIHLNISTGFGYGWTIYYVLEYTKTTD